MPEVVTAEPGHWPRYPLELEKVGPGDYRICVAIAGQGDDAETDPAEDASLIAVLKGVLTQQNAIIAKLDANATVQANILTELQTLNAAIAAGITVSIG